MLNIFKKGSEVICLNMSLYGIMGRVSKFDKQKNTIKVEFDKDEEESKIHDPFLGQFCLNNQGFIKKSQMKQYYTARQIEKKLKLKSGIIGRITSSFLITYSDLSKKDR